MEKTHSPTVHIETHGCKLNQADSQELARDFTQKGYMVIGEEQGADVYVVNTCTVTHVADRKARQALRDARHQNPNSMIVATGCYAQRAHQELLNVPGVDMVVGNTDKETLVDQMAGLLEQQEVACSTGSPISLDLSTDPNFPLHWAFADQELSGELQLEQTTGKPRPLRHPLPTQEPSKSRKRAMVKIQEGCNQVCAYCIVPKVRGRERSIHPSVLVAKVQQLSDEGHQEVVLTGTQLGSYGFDIPGIDLTHLVSKLLHETTVPRLRVSSLQPQEITAELIDLWGNPRLCPHFHLPLQSGSAAVLRRMRRRYTPLDYAKAVEYIRSRIPNASITADLIVGFPGETSAQFLESYRLCKRLGFAGMHVFPYSVRPGTSAAHFGNSVDNLEKRARMKKVLSLAKRQARIYRQGLLGITKNVLWEHSAQVGRSTIWSGLTDNYVRVATRSDEPLRNRITEVTLEQLRGDTLWGRIPTRVC